ncbi:3-deoxy-D-manno-octulosonic acid transferase [Aquifex sp.]
MSKKWELSKRLFLKELPKIRSPLWIHTASVGEFNTALPLIRELKKEHNILITYSSPRAREYLENFSREYDALYPLPADLPFLIRKFEERIKPKALIILERELWPFLIKSTKAKKILINAYTKGSLLEKILAKEFSLIITRRKKDAEIFRRFGAKKVISCGNLKLIYEHTPRSLNLPEGNYIVAGSTHEGEEEIILKAFKELNLGDIKLIIAPRHVERSNKVKELSESLGLKTSLYSENENPWEVLVVDRLGLLRDLYAHAKVAIVGGTFVPVGGHNLLEPAYYKVPVVFGKFTRKVEDLKEVLLSLGLGFQANTPEELKELLKFLLLEFKIPSVDLKEMGRKVKECYLRAIREELSSS